MSHLGDRIAALVDGELGHEARDRTLAHLAMCSDCRAAADAERRTRSMLGGLDGPEPSSDLVRSLLALAAESGGPMPPTRRTFPAAGRPPTVNPAGRRPVGGPDAGRRPGDRPHRRLRFVAAGALSGFAVMMGTALVAGAPPEEAGTPLTPPIDRYTVEHASTTGGIPFIDPDFANYSGSLLSGAVEPAYLTAPPVPPMAPMPAGSPHSPLTGARLYGGVLAR